MHKHSVMIVEIDLIEIEPSMHGINIGLQTNMYTLVFTNQTKTHTKIDNIFL